MIRILVFGMTENPGGVESFLINYYRHIDRSRIQFDFLCNFHGSVAYENELIELGGRIFHITPRSQNRPMFRKVLNDFFRKHALEWKAVWVNVCSLANIDYLKVAKQFGIPKRVIHSHNSRNMDDALRGMLHRWNKRHVKDYATDFWACSMDAAHWFYNDRIMKNVIVIHNAIDVERMKYDEGKRETIRDLYGLEEKYVIGNVGRLHFQKNQAFIIDVFRLFHEENADSVLVLVGQGEDECELKKKVASYGLEDSVFFAGVQRDIQAWMSCFDLFLFPSRFEGLSIAALEAQANGVPVLASKGVIPVEVKMNDNFVFFDLEQGQKTWAKEIGSMRKMERESYDAVKKNFIEKGYDIKREAKKLEELLLKQTG